MAVFILSKVTPAIVAARTVTRLVTMRSTGMVYQLISHKRPATFVAGYGDSLSLREDLLLTSMLQRFLLACMLFLLAQ